MGDVKVSVVCPVFNKEEHIATCINSCLSQSLQDIEVIAVDDGSTDGSLGVLKELATNDLRLLIYDKQNEGAGSARNYALERAHGEFVFFIDGDDYIPTDTALEELYSAAKENGVAVAGGSMCIDRDGTVDFDSLHGSALDSFSANEVVDYSDYQYDYDFTRYLYSRKMLDDCQIRFPTLRQFEDPPFFVNAMIAAQRFATITTAVYAYRYGYQPGRKWSAQAVIDRVNGIHDLLKLGKEHSYATLQRHLADQLSEEMTYVILDHAGDRRVMSAVYRAQGAIDADLVRAEYPDFPDDYVIEALAIIADGYMRLEYFKNTKPGRAYRRLRARR